jgi:hypothetical protein
VGRAWMERVMLTMRIRRRYGVPRHEARFFGAKRAIYAICGSPHITQ